MANQLIDAQERRGRPATRWIKTVAEIKLLNDTHEDPNRRPGSLLMVPKSKNLKPSWLKVALQVFPLFITMCLGVDDLISSPRGPTARKPH